MKIVIVGASGTLGKPVTAAFAAGHEIIRVGLRSGDVQVDISSPESIDHMYAQVGSFDALICTAGDAWFGPWASATDRLFRTGIDSKLMGQINLVLIGQHYAHPGGSFTLTTGVLGRDPVRGGANVSVANGGVEAFVRAAAIELPNGLRINAVSPTVVEDAPDYFPFFPGHVPVTMDRVVAAYQKSVLGAGTGQVIEVN